MGNTLMIGSCEPFSGKSAVVLGVARKLMACNQQIRFGKPLATSLELESTHSLVSSGAPLIDDDVQETINKVPVLGNIPLLGRVFTSTTTTRTKRNLMVFLRPTIVRDSEDVRSISNRKYNYFQAIEAELLESGKLVPDTSILDVLLTAPKEED